MFPAYIVKRVAVRIKTPFYQGCHASPRIVVAVQELGYKSAEVGGPVGGVTGGSRLGRQGATYHTMHTAGSPVHEVTHGFAVEQIGK